MLYAQTKQIRLTRVSDPDVHGTNSPHRELSSCKLSPSEPPCPRGDFISYTEFTAKQLLVFQNTMRFVLFGNKQHVFKLALNNYLVGGRKLMKSLFLEESIQSFQSAWRGEVFSGSVSPDRRYARKDD